MADALTMTEALLAARLGRAPSPGEHVVVPVDTVYMHDGTFPLALRALREAGLEDSVDPARLVLFIDHAAPAPSVAAAQVHAEMRRFARRHGVRLYDVGSGICHQVAVEEGLAAPGRIVFGADSHTVTLGALGAFATGVGSTDAALAAASGRLWVRVPEQVRVRLTGRLPRASMGKDAALALLGELGSSGAVYRALEFQGEGVHSLSMDSRLTLSNMSVEAGAMLGLFPVDGLAAAWLERVAGVAPAPRLSPSPGASYDDEVELELDRVEPMVAAPGRVDNVHAAAELEGMEVDQVFIGSCTNGRLEDLLAAARILRGKRVKTRCVVVAASRRVFSAALRLGAIEALVEAGCAVTHSTCGPCLGAHFGLLAEGETAVSTSNRNFAGRMGHRGSRVVLASPATAAASAAEGRLVDPTPLVKTPLVEPRLIEHYAAAR